MVIILGDVGFEILRKKMIGLKKILLAAVVVCSMFSFEASAQTSKLKAYDNIDKKYSKETSGIVKSRSKKGLFWVLDDSGNEDRIYAITKKGEAFAKGDYKGQKIKGAKNRDWEDILADDKGHIIIADIGNNCRCREDLAFYVLEETKPSEEKNEVIQKIRFSYPPIYIAGIPKSTNYDSEAAFFFDDHIYLLTKHGWLDRKTRLYKVPNVDSSYAEVELEFIEEIKMDGAVTAADYDEENKRLSILTYTSVWVFETSEDGDLFTGKAFRKSIKADQVESITFDKDALIIVDEKKGNLYRIDISELEEVNF